MENINRSTAFWTIIWGTNCNIYITKKMYSFSDRGARLWAEQLRVQILARATDFLFPIMSKTAMGPIHPLIQWAWCENDYSPPPSVEIMNNIQVLLSKWSWHGAYLYCCTVISLHISWCCAYYIAIPPIPYTSPQHRAYLNTRTTFAHAQFLYRYCMCLKLKVDLVLN